MAEFGVGGSYDGGGATATSGGGEFDWNQAFDTVAGLGFEVWDRHTYTDQERVRDQIRTQPVVDDGGGGSGGGGMDQDTMMMLGAGFAALLLVVVVAK